MVSVYPYSYSIQPKTSTLLRWIKTEPYGRDKAANYYINKLISEGAIPYDHNLDKLRYTGPADLLEATRSSPYVEERLSSKTLGEYLVIRHGPGAMQQGNVSTSDKIVLPWKRFWVHTSSSFSAAV